MNTTFGRYRLLELLGQGGMAEVFKAKSYGVEGFEKVVVIKRILPALAASSQFVAMFIHEAKLAVRLSHANVVQVFDLGLAPGAAATDGTSQPDAYYMAMEYVNGLDLATLLARCRRQGVHVPVEMAVYIAGEVAKGLDHAHRRRDEQGRPLNIVHLDVSPQNVLLSLEGEVKVTDFGIAKAVGAFESTGTEDTRIRQLKGKFGYMSPEHAKGGLVDARSDLFSLGTVLYELLAGVNPFRAPTSIETLRRVSVVEFPPLEILRPDVPPELAALLNIALAPRVEERFADAGRMYEALLAFLYAQGKRFSAHDLASFLAQFCTQDETGPHVVLDAESSSSEDRTPVEVPRPHRDWGTPSQPSSNRIEAAAPVPVVDVDSVVGMGERREVTALVIALSGRDDASLAARATETIARHGGRVVDHEPEQIVALFGLDDPDGRDTEVATRCALVVLRALAGPKAPGAGLHVARIHVSADGVPTEGESLASLITTARDLARAREGLCAISATAMRQIRHVFVFDSLSESHPPMPSRAPGYSSTTTFFVREVRGASEAFGRFVGRKDELRTVGEVIGHATRRSARVLSVRGDHGIGKTRLLLEVERRLNKGGYNVGWHFATCLPRGTEVPLSGIQCMLQALCAVAEGDAEARIVQVVPRLRALGLQDDEVGAVLALLGAGPRASRPQANAKPSLVNAFTRMILRLCEDKPHVFAWDSAHALDSESFGVLETVLSRIPQARALIVLAARAGFSHPLETLPVHTSLDLADLKPEDAERLIALRLKLSSPHVVPELLRFVRERSDGHPQVIEEIVKALVEARAVTVADGAIVRMKLVDQDLALPKTLRGLVASRVARLTAVERAILQAAAVLGEPVNVGVLAQITALDLTRLERSLVVLRERSFLVHVAPLELRFTSPIVREVVVDALTVEATRQMHAAAGRALETAQPGHEATERDASRIATHLYAAGERERAGEWFAKSAARHLEKGSLEAAVRDFARTIELCDPSSRDPRELAAWLGGLAKAVRLVRSLPEATELCDRVIAHVDAAVAIGENETTSKFAIRNHEGLELRVRARIDAGRIFGALHMFDAARSHFSAAETLARGRDELVNSALVAAAEFAGRQGDFKRSLALLEHLESIVATRGDKVEEHKLLVSLVQTHAAMGEHHAALKHFERAEQLLPTEPLFVCERHKLRGLIAYFARDFQLAAHHCEKAIGLARALGLPYEVAVNLHNLGDVLVHVLDYPWAYGAINQSLALCNELGHDRLASHNRMFLAFLDGLAGEVDADRVLRQGIRYAEANEFTWDLLGGRMLLAKLLEHRGDLDGARLEFQALRALARAAGNRLVTDDCGVALRALGVPSSRPPPPLPPSEPT